MTRHRSPVPRVFSAAVTVLLLIAILGPFFQVLQGALFQGTGFSLEAIYKVFLATPGYLLVFWRTIALCALIVAGQVVLSVLAGMGFAKCDFPGKKLWFFLLLVVMVLPLLLFLGLHKELVRGIALQEDWAGESCHRGFFRALALALVVLTECTFLSTAVSREMAVEVVTARPRYDREMGIQSLPVDAFHQEEDSTFLYLLEEGVGLLGSTQLRRVPADILSLEGDRAFTTSLEQGGSYVVYASRPLEDEALAVEIASSDPAPDTYLLWAPEGVELDALSASVEGGTLYLLPQEEAPQPFLAQRELAALLPGEEREHCRLFSLGDVEQFAHQLPLLGAAGVLILAPLVCAVGLCLSKGKRGMGKAKALWCLLLAASLGGLFLLLQQVALPASLMPPETIFDLGYYSETLQRLENGLSAFSDSDLCGELAALLARQKTIALAIFVGGCIVLGTGLLLGMGYKRRKTPRKEKIR